jgi:MYXO-CTERM domain-containing protein
LSFPAAAADVNAAVVLRCVGCSCAAAALATQVLLLLLLLLLGLLLLLRKCWLLL